ncbi:hypothetical protein ACVTNA_30035, partial [Escherichia coli]
QRSGAAGRDLLLWNNCGTDEYLYPGLVGKSFFHALFLQIISIWEAVLLQIKFIKKCIWGVRLKSSW